MASGLLALKWNNHSSTFLHVLSSLRHKDSYCDATIACEGIFYPVHKIVLSTCSEYFDQIFQRTQCKHPVIVLKDVRPDDLEALLNYMYLGEVNVLQDRLSGLIKNAESLRIKGLAVPDEEPKQNLNLSREKRNLGNNSERSPHAKRRRRDGDTDDSGERQRNNKAKSESGHSESELNDNEERSDIKGAEKGSSYDTDSKSKVNENSDKRNDSDKSTGTSQTQSNSLHNNDSSEPIIVKDEPSDVEEETDDKMDLHDHLGFNTMDSGGADDVDDINYGSHSIGSQPPSVDEVLGHAMPGPSGLQQASNVWDGDGSGMSGGAMENFNSDLSQNRQSDGDLSYETSNWIWNENEIANWNQGMSHTPVVSGDPQLPIVSNIRPARRWTLKQKEYIAKVCRDIGPTATSRHIFKQFGVVINESSVRNISKQMMNKSRK